MVGVDENLWASLQARSYCSFVLPSWKTLTKSKEETGLYIVVPQHDLYSGESQRLSLPTYRSNLRPVEEGGRWGPDVFRLVRDLVALKVAPIHPLLRRSCALGYTRRWWSILAMRAQTAAVDCILNQDSPIPVDCTQWCAAAGRHFPLGRYRSRAVPDCLIRGRLGNESSIGMRPRSSHFIFAGIT